jgi:glycosyltransferase involved in cell wall biosynthesis
MLTMHIIFELRMGGIASVIQNYVLSMPKDELMTLVIFRMPDDQKILSRFKPLLTHPNVTVVNLNKRRRKDIVQTVFKLDQLFKEANQKTIIVSHLEEVTRYIFLANIRYKLNLVQVIHNDVFHDFWLHQWMLKHYIRGYIFVSNSSLNKHVSLGHSNMRYIQNGLYFEERAPVKRKDLVFVGRLEKQKNPLLCVQLYHHAIEDIQDPPRLIMIGSGPLKSEIEAYIHDHDLQKHIMIEDRNDDILNVFNQAILALMTSDYEGTPMVVLEAMSQGCPYLAFDVGGLSSIIDQQTGFLVPAFDHSLYISMIKNLVLNPFRLDDMRPHIKISVQSLSSETMVQSYHKVFQEILTRRKP